MTTKWVCSKCGSDATTINAARPSIDDRFAVGYCTFCCPVPKLDPSDPTGQRTKPLNRPTVPLVRSDVWDPAKLEARRQHEAEERLLTTYRNGGRLTDAQADRAQELIRRFDQEAAARRAG